MNREKLESAKNLFFIALWLDIAVTALVVISNFWRVGVLQVIAAGEITADQSLISTLEFWDSFAKLMLLTILGVGLGLVKWLNACYSYAKESIGASGFKNEGWIAVSWIIPIFNLFKPYQVINEIYKVGSPAYAVPDGWKKESGSGLLLTWWIFWAVTHFIGWIIGKLMFKSAMRDDMTLQQSIGALEMQSWFCVVSLIVSGLWLVVANGLTRRLLERKIAGGSSSSQIEISTTFVADGFDEDAAYSEVAHELETKTMDKGLWLKAMMQTGDGDERQQAMAYTRMRLKTLETAFAATSAVSRTPAMNPALESTTDSQGVQPVPTTPNSDMDSNRPPSMHAGDAWTYAAAAAAVLIVFLYLMSNTTTPPVSEATTSTGATGEPLGKQREIAKYEAAPTQFTQSEQPAYLAAAAAAAPTTAPAPAPMSMFQDILDDFDKAIAAGGRSQATRTPFSQRPYDSMSGQIPLTEVVPAPPPTTWPPKPR